VAKERFHGEEFHGEAFRGLEIELDGEADEYAGQSQSEAPADGLADDYSGDPWLLPRAWWRRAARVLTWRAAAWVAGAALLGFGVGAVGEPAAKQVTADYLSTDFGLHLGNQPITAPGQAQMAKLTGAAWSDSPTTTLVVHVVNDGSKTLHLHTGTLSGQHLSHGALVPDGTGVLAPGQSGTLTAQVAVTCGTSSGTAVEGSAAQPLTADIPVNAGSGPSSTVQLVAGNGPDDLYIATQLCAGLPPPLAVSFKNIIGPNAQGGGAIQITVHNITEQSIRFVPEFGFQTVNTAKMQALAAGATTVVDLPLTQVCSAAGQSAYAPSVGVYMLTVDGSYQTGYEESIGTNPQVSVCHG
jgi:hypothetical protein